MDDPGASIFQGTNIIVNTSRNEEEEEDLEDQKRRNEELQNLLTTKLDDFNYDESTVNSSIISAISIDDSQNKYIEADNEGDQLKIIYEVRCRELQALRQEFKSKTDNLTQQVVTLQKKCLLSEAELEQLKVSYKNGEELLAEKSQIIKELSSVLESKEKQIDEFQKNTENLHLEIATYKSTIDDIHMQLQGDRNPFGSSNKHFNSEELKKAHQEQVNRLESLLDEKTRHAKHIERENLALKEELNKLIHANTDSSKLINTLTKNFESAQNQCQDLIDVIETVSNENKHLQERLNNVYNESPNKRHSLDYNSLTSHVDKLKKMLVDKAVQINTLNVKLRNYEENLKELLEYRKLKTDAYQKEFQQCENEDHTKNLLLMQNDLQNYRRIIDDKNQQILNLNSTNKDLLAKMEETLSQTRNDIKQFSNKYSLPQLQKMTEDLKLAQNHISELEDKLKTTEEALNQIQKERVKEESLKEELQELKLVTEKERNNFENEKRKLQSELDTSTSEIKNLKLYIEELMNENSKFKSQFKNSDINDETLKKQYIEAVQAHGVSQNRVKHLLENVDELTNKKNALEGEHYALEIEAKDVKNKLENLQKHLSNIEVELDNAKEDLKGKDEIIQQLQEVITSLKTELKKISEYNKRDKKESFTQTEILDQKEPESEKKIRRNLDSELLAAEEFERDKEAQLISLELKLREEIQKDYFNKLEAIEEKYQNACGSSTDLRREYVQKLKTQESKLREYSALILSECTQKIKQYENHIGELNKKMSVLQNHFDEYKVLSNKREQHFIKLIQELQIKNQRETEKWKLWSQKLVNNCLKLESANKKTCDNILFKMQRYDSNIATVEKTYEKAKKRLNKK